MAISCGVGTKTQEYWVLVQPIPSFYRYFEPACRLLALQQSCSVGISTSGRVLRMIKLPDPTIDPFEQAS